MLERKLPGEPGTARCSASWGVRKLREVRGRDREDLLRPWRHDLDVVARRGWRSV
jgi:hypothetical protein